MLCSRCKSNDVKFANTTLCEECDTDPQVMPSVVMIGLPSFIANECRLAGVNINRQNQEQRQRSDELHDPDYEDQGMSLAAMRNRRGFCSS